MTRVAKIPRCKFSAEELLALFEKRRYNNCPQHTDAMQKLAELAVKYHWVSGVAECNEVVIRRSGICQVEVKLRVSKSASAASREDFVSRAEQLGWHAQPNPDERLIWLNSPTGMRLSDGSVPPEEGAQRVAIFRREQDMFGERLMMIGKPAWGINRSSLECKAEEMSQVAPGHEYVVHTVRWQCGLWQVAPDGDDEDKH